MHYFLFATEPEFVNTATLLPLDESVTRQAIILRRKYKKLKLGDAIIAATAINYELALITHNIADFNKIHSLQIIDPYNMNQSNNPGF